LLALTPAQLAVAGMAVVFVGIAKAGFGGGIGILVTPMMALAISPKDSVGIMLPILCACDLTAIWHYRKTWDRRNVAMLLPGAVVGVGAGALLLGNLSDNWLGLSIGLIAVLFVLRHFWLEFHQTQSAPYRPNWAQGTGFGLGAGLTSTLAHAAGPVTTMFLLPQRMDRMRFVGTTVIFFTLVNGVKLIPYGLLHVITRDTLRASLALAAFVPAGVFLGIWMNTRINEKWFNPVVYGVLFLAGIDLIQKNLTRIAGG